MLQRCVSDWPSQTTQWWYSRQAWLHRCTSLLLSAGGIWTPCIHKTRASMVCKHRLDLPVGCSRSELNVCCILVSIVMAGVLPTTTRKVFVFKCTGVSFVLFLKSMPSFLRVLHIMTSHGDWNGLPEWPWCQFNTPSWDKLGWTPWLAVYVFVGFCFHVHRCKFRCVLGTHTFFPARIAHHSQSRWLKWTHWMTMVSV